MTQEDGMTYTITKVTDFLAIPEDRRMVAYREFEAWLGFFGGIAPLIEGGVVDPPEAFIWVDDGLGEARVIFEDRETGEELISETFPIGRTA